MPFLKSGLDFVELLESVTDAARRDTFLCARISPNSRSGPKISYWDVSEKQSLPMIVTHIHLLRKAHRKYSFLGTGLLFDRSGRYYLHAFLAKQNLTWGEEHEIRIPLRNPLTLDYYADKTIAAWKSLLRK